MQHDINSVIGISMQATDEKIEKMKEFYFDGQHLPI